MFIKMKEIIQNLNILNYENNKTEEEIYNETIFEIIENYITNENYDLSKLVNSEDELINLKRIKITLTTTQYQKYQKNINNNKTVIIFDKCENILRENYNISKDELLYIKKIDIFEEGMNIPKIEYEVYRKISKRYLEKLNLSICKNTDIDILVPIILSENIDILNSSSGYYNDI